MSENVERIRNELEGLGYSTKLTESPKGKVVSFDYRVELGSYIGKSVRVGLSMQGEEAYPEYPPHWVHLCPPIDDRRGGVVEQYTDECGYTWSVLSRPPGPIWDRLLTKHISGYISDHLRRFWIDL